MVPSTLNMEPSTLDKKIDSNQYIINISWLSLSVRTGVGICRHGWHFGRLKQPPRNYVCSFFFFFCA